MNFWRQLCGPHQGQQPFGLRKHAEHMDAPDRGSSLLKALAPQGSPHMGQVWADREAPETLPSGI